MCLSVDGTHLVSGDQSGLIYVWSTQAIHSSDEEGTGLISTYELHKDKGQITNLVALHRPLSLFGLTANMKSFEVPEISPLQKFPGPCKDVIEINLQIIDKPCDMPDKLSLALEQCQEDSYFI